MTTTTRTFLLNQLGEMSEFLEKSFRGLSRDLLLRTPATDNLSLLEHLWHVRDCESELYTPWIVGVLTEERCRLMPVAIDGWPSERRYDLRDGDQAIREFGELRRDLIARLQATSDESFLRTGLVRDDREVGVYRLIEQLIEHDRDHRWRMCALLRECAERPVV
ncbi:MAG: DinB family protein [Paraburkholderia sp.]|jgi:hypothetical protein